MKIYTKTGDAGETGLFGGGRVPKDDERVDAYGEVDELNADAGPGAQLLHAARSWTGCCSGCRTSCSRVGAVLATPLGTKASAHIPQLQPEWVEAMEKAIDSFETELPTMTHFILPGGSQASGRAAPGAHGVPAGGAARRAAAARGEGLQRTWGFSSTGSRICSSSWPGWPTTGWASQM